MPRSGSSVGRAPPRHGGGCWFDPSSGHARQLARWTNWKSRLAFTQDMCGFEARPRCVRRSFRCRPIWQGRRLLTVQVPVRARAPERFEVHARIAQRKSAAVTRRMPQVRSLVRVPRGCADVGESGPAVTRLLTQGSSNLSTRTVARAAPHQHGRMPEWFQGTACKAVHAGSNPASASGVPSTVEFACSPPLTRVCR